MKNRFLLRNHTVMAAIAASAIFAPRVHALPQDAQTVASLYSTMPSAFIHRPEMAMDGDEKTYFRSFYSMADGDDFQVLLSKPIVVRNLKIITGDEQNNDALTSGRVEISSDGNVYRSVAKFGANGVAEVKLPRNTRVAGLKIRLNEGQGISGLLVREIVLDSPDKPVRAQRGAGRPFQDWSAHPDVEAWARRAQVQMEEFWGDTAALLYSDGFITPNKVNIFYRTGPNVTGVAAYGGGVMEVNADWCRKNPNDTGLTVHEVAHAIQAMSAYNPVWLVEGVADYIRWAKYEPQNHRPRIDVTKASYRDSYRTTGTFLAWCEMKYDSALVRKLNHAVRFATYKPEMWKTFTGKDVDTLWSEFIEAYKVQGADILTTPVAAADRPRILPVVQAGSSVAVDLKNAFNASGFSADGVRFGGNSGFDGGGATFSANLLGTSQTSNNVRFDFGPVNGQNLIAAKGQKIALPAGQFASLWLLGAAVEGNQMAQTLTVTYTDGSTQTLAQNFSDWYAPRNFPGESRAVKMAYRNLGNGARDPRPFTAYSYGFALEPNKTVQSLALPDNEAVRILAISLAK